MNTANVQLQVVKSKLKDLVKRIKISEPIKRKINIVKRIKDIKVSSRHNQWKQQPQPSNLNRFIRSIKEVFGFTAVMSISVLFIVGVLCLSFFINVLLAFFQEYAWLLLGVAGVMIGVGWFKPFKFWSVSLTLLGTFLLVTTFGPFIVEGYTGRNLMDVNYRNGYWLTLKASFVFVIYLFSAITFVTWIYLISKKRRPNPLMWFRYVKFSMKNE